MGLLTRQEAAARLRIGLRTLDRRLAAGDIPCYRFGDGPRPQVRISEKQIAEYLDSASSGDRHEVSRQVHAIMGR
jgi:excisionase family DNA binding protein